MFEEGFCTIGEGLTSKLFAASDTFELLEVPVQSDFSCGSKSLLSRRLHDVASLKVGGRVEAGRTVSAFQPKFLTVEVF
jgi:hypothetical protein